MNRKPSLYMCFRWYWYDHLNEQTLLEKGCSVNNIKKVKDIVCRLECRESLTSLEIDKATRRELVKIQNLYNGQLPLNCFSASSAYRLLLKGENEFYLKKRGFNDLDIQKAMIFRNIYENEDILSAEIAKQIGVTKNVAANMQRLCLEHYSSA